MSKPIAITPAAIITMIEEVNEHITAVSTSTIDHVVVTIRASIHEDAEVTESQIHDIVSYWILRDVISADVMLKAARSIEEDMAEEPEVYGESWAWEANKYRAIAELVA